MVGRAELASLEAAAAGYDPKVAYYDMIESHAGGDHSGSSPAPECRTPRARSVGRGRHWREGAMTRCPTASRSSRCGTSRAPRVEVVEWRIRSCTPVPSSSTPAVVRVLETSQAPAYYVAFEHVADQFLRRTTTAATASGRASRRTPTSSSAPDRAPRPAWSYAEPTPGFEPLIGHWAFYAQALDECWVDDERVLPNDGNFYGGWVTSNVHGPIKGAPGTLHW